MVVAFILVVFMVFVGILVIVVVVGTVFSTALVESASVVIV